MTPDDERTPERSALSAMAAGLCPRCRRGRIFSSAWTMNVRCPECGLEFEREHGYFTGAMYVSYALGIPAICLFTLILWLIFSKWEIWQLVLLSWIAFLPLVPFVFRYSRILWIYFDRSIDK